MVQVHNWIYTYKLPVELQKNIKQYEAEWIYFSNEIAYINLALYTVTSMHSQPAFFWMGERHKDKIYMDLAVLYVW